MRASDDKKQKARELLKITKAIKALEEKQRILKEFFKEHADGIINAGTVAVMIESRSRRFLDREKLAAELGDLRKFERSTSYRMVRVVERKAA